MVTDSKDIAEKQAAYRIEAKARIDKEEAARDKATYDLLGQQATIESADDVVIQIENSVPANYVAKVVAYAKAKNLRIVVGPYSGIVASASTDRERLIESAVNRMVSGERIYQEERDA